MVQPLGISCISRQGLKKKMFTSTDHSKKLLRTEQKNESTWVIFSKKMLQHTSLVPCSILNFRKGNQFVSEKITIQRLPYRFLSGAEVNGRFLSGHPNVLRQLVGSRRAITQHLFSAGSRWRFFSAWVVGWRKSSFMELWLKTGWGCKLVFKQQVILEGFTVIVTTVLQFCWLGSISLVVRV